MTKQRADGDAPSSSNKKLGLADRAFWLKDEIINDPQCMAWLEMCEAIKKCGDPKPLLDLLQAQGVIPAKVSDYVGDFFESYQLQKKQGKGRRIPLYDRSPKQAEQLFASKLVRAYVEGRMGYPSMAERKAIDLVAEAFELDSHTLADVYHDRHGGMRRLKQRAKRA